MGCIPEGFTAAIALCAAPDRFGPTWGRGIHVGLLMTDPPRFPIEVDSDSISSRP